VTPAIAIKSSQAVASDDWLLTQILGLAAQGLRHRGVKGLAQLYRCAARGWFSSTTTRGESMVAESDVVATSICQVNGDTKMSGCELMRLI
jgi:hypothetical protein